MSKHKIKLIVLLALLGGVTVGCTKETESDNTTIVTTAQTATYVVDDRQYYANPQTETSIDKHDGDQLWAVGHRPQHQDSVVLFHQNMAYPDISCYSQMFPMAGKLAEMVKPDTEDSGLNEVGVSPIQLTTWQRLEAVPNWMKLRCLSRERDTDDSEDGDETDDELE